ncbi:protein MpPPR_43 [Marchantia polymorpha subsp. ruderalis]
MPTGMLSLCSRAGLGILAQDKSYSSVTPARNPTHAFFYDRASPAVRWPHLHSKLTESPQNQQQQTSSSENVEKQEFGESTSSEQFTPAGRGRAKDRPDGGLDNAQHDETSAVSAVDGESCRDVQSDYNLVSGKQKRWKMSKLALLKATDWRERVQRLTEAMCQLESEQTVADLLERWPEQLAPTDYCLVVKQVGFKDWARALELFEWLNMKHWYTPNNRMLSTILGVLGRVNQVNLAEELFQRAEPELGDCVQVFNAILSVHARHGNWERMQELLRMMLLKSCERDLVTYNTLISGRAKAGLQPGMAMDLLREIWKAGLRPDTVTYNTLISACSSNKCHEDAVKIYDEMKEQGCLPDIWTYNAIISVYGRCGLDDYAEEAYKTMKAKGFLPDAITYNSILYAYAKKGRVDDVELILRQMKDAGREADEITYNTMIHMYGKKNLTSKALDLYEQMKRSRRYPDTVTFTVLIDGLGKAGEVKEAERIFNEMSQAAVKPSLNTYSAMICAYAKASLFKDAEGTFECMLQAGIQPDGLALSVMLDVYLNSGQANRVLPTYQRMVTRGIKPGLGQCGLMLRLYQKEGLLGEIERLCEDMRSAAYDPIALCTTFAKAGLIHASERALKDANARGRKLDPSAVDALMNAYVKAGMYKDAKELVDFIPFSDRGKIREQLIVTLANGEKFEEANEEFVKLKASGQGVSVKVFRSLIVTYERAGMPERALDILKEMEELGVRPDAVCLKSAVLASCRVGDPDRGHMLLRRMVAEFGSVGDSYLHMYVAKAYIKHQSWDNLESVLEHVTKSGLRISTKDYNTILLALAECGQFQQLERLVQKMILDGSSPSSSFTNALLEAILKVGSMADAADAHRRFSELGIPTDMETDLMMLQGFAKDLNVVKAKGIYRDSRMKGYFLPVWAFKVLIGLFSKVGCPEDAETTLKEMQQSGYQPDTFVYNAMISLYSKVGDFQKAAQVFQGMKDVGFSPDTITYNTLIHVYSRRLLVREAYSLLQQMQKAGCAPDLASYTMLLSAYGQMQMWEAATACFKELQELGIQPDEATYNIMIDVYRRSGKSDLSQVILSQMKEQGLEPSRTTMSLVMDSYGKSGDTESAEAVFDEMVEAGVDVNVIQYTSLIDGYLKEGKFEAAVAKLRRMQAEGIVPNYVTWTCFVAAASKCEERKDALMLLKALQECGFSLPLRLLTERSRSLLTEVDDLTSNFQATGTGSGSGFLNVLQDLLWAFEKRATAAYVFQSAADKNIYGRDFFRVEEGDWEADFCKLSPGASLVALHLWLMQMQEAALTGRPLSPKSVLLIIGSSKRSNHQSVNKTLMAHLWSMGSPFLVSKTRAGVLIAKGHSLRMWLKDSPKCFDLELEDRPSPPEFNSMQAYEEAWMPRDLVPAFQQIEKTMGTTLRPKKFMRLVNLEEEKRADVIAADIRGRTEKAARDKAKKRHAKVGLGPPGNKSNIGLSSKKV